MKIVAREGQNVYLLDLNHGFGQVLDLEQKLLFLPFNIHSLWTFGRLWADYSGPQTILPGLLAQVTQVLPPPSSPLRSHDEVLRWLKARGFAASSQKGAAPPAPLPGRKLR